VIEQGLIHALRCNPVVGALARAAFPEPLVGVVGHHSTDALHSTNSPTDAEAEEEVGVIA
jgi:hypothetical protein